MFAIYTHNRFNQIMLFQTYDEAYHWCKKATRWTENEIKYSIKKVIKSSSGTSHYNIFDV